MNACMYVYPTVEGYQLLCWSLVCEMCQVGGNDGSCFLKSILALCVAYDSGMALINLNCWIQDLSVSFLSVWLDSMTWTWPINNRFWSNEQDFNIISNFSKMDKHRAIQNFATNLYFFPLMFGQNDLVHAWALDFQLGYCAQAIFPSYDHTHAHKHISICSYLEQISYVQSRVIEPKTLVLLILSTSSIMVYPR